MAEEAEMQAGQAKVSERVGGDAMSVNEEIKRALLQALACREDRKRSEKALESLERKENEAMEQLQELVRAQGKDATPT